MKICAIDPGLNGAIVIYDGEYHILQDYKIKNENGKNELDIPTIINFLKEHKPDYTLIEQQLAIPQQSVIATATTMKNYGIFLGILNALDINYTTTIPRNWMKHFVGKLKYEKKLGAQILIDKEESFKDILYTKRGRLLDGIVDAALMNIYLRENLKKAEKKVNKINIENPKGQE
jgi:hypothetical protein